jgi:hypothetical protein
MRKEGGIMDQNIDGEVEFFIDAVNSLFTEIQSWLAQTNLEGMQEETEISEEASGTYALKKMALEDKGKKKIAEFLPIGAFVIGGDGRVDMVGRIDKAILVHLGKDASMKTQMMDGDSIETTTVPFFEGVERPGWYWIENGKRGKANFFNRELFIELLREVSDYEIGERP